MISLLLENGADIEAFAKYPFVINLGWTFSRNPLHLAIKNKEIEIAKFLLDKGADIEAYDQAGNTAIFHAIHSDSLEMVKLLIERGADFKVQNMVFSTPLNHSTGKACFLPTRLEK